MAIVNLPSSNSSILPSPFKTLISYKLIYTYHKGDLMKGKMKLKNNSKRIIRKSFFYLVIIYSIFSITFYYSLKNSTKINNTKFINFLLGGGNSHLIEDYKLVNIVNTSTNFLFNIDLKNPSSILDQGVLMYGNNEKDHHETINGESLVQIVSMKELIITVYTILIDRDYMLNNIKTKVEEQFKPGSAEYNLGAKYYIRMKLAKTYEEAKGIYNDALVQLSSLDTIEENKKTSSR